MLKMSAVNRIFNSHAIELKFLFICVFRSAESYSQYVSKMPWVAVPYEDEESRAQLTSLFGIQGIPSLILLNPDGSIITEDGRGEVNEDPEGLVSKIKSLINSLSIT